MKTRIGYDKPDTKNWITTIAETRPDFISLHGRTFKQMYKGEADWGEVKKAVEITDIPIIGNGDIESYEDAQSKLKQVTCWGVMMGRGAVGVPWVFKKVKEIPLHEVKKIALEHARLYVKYKGERKFYEMRKHLVKYFRSFEGAKELRKKIVLVSDLKELEMVLRNSTVGS